MVDEKWLTQAKRGVVELCILNLVNQNDVYGYQLVRRLAAVPGLVITVGTIYPLLSRLKREGLLSSSLIESDAGPARRIYRLTPEGRRHLSTINDAWREIAGAVAEVMKPPRPH